MQWDRARLKHAALSRKLIVLDLRNNGGGSIQNVLFLLEDLVSAFCPKKTLALFQKEFVAFSHCKQMSKEFLYDLFLFRGAEAVRGIVEEFVARDQCSDRTRVSKALAQLNRLTAGLIKTGNRPVAVAVLINEKCFSACRDAAIYLSALPNVVIVGDEINLKNAVAYMPGTQTVTTDTITFHIGQIGTANGSQRYVPLKPDFPSRLASSGMRHALELYTRLPEIHKIIDA